MKSSKDIYLGIDIGTTSIKAGLVDEDGKGLLQSTVEYPTYPLGHAQVEQSALDWWDAATRAVRELTDAHPDLAKRICGISVSSQAPTLLGVAADGQPVGRGMIWMDQRAGDICRDVLQPHADYIHQFSCNRTDPYFTLPKLVWQKQHQGEAYHAVDRYLQINGWIVFRLTGVYSIDQSSAALTQTLNVHTMQTEEQLFPLLGLDRAKWPEVYPCDAVVGTVLDEMADLWQIPRKTPVAAGCIDGASSPLGLDVVHGGDIFEMSGQSSGIGVVLEKPRYHPNLCLLRHAVNDAWILKGSMSCSGGSLKWFRDHVDGGITDFNSYNQLAEQSVPGAHGVVFLPYLCGERAPLWDRTLRGVYFGLGTDTTKADLVRAVMEGTAYALRTIWDEFADPSMQQKVVLGTGGGYNSAIWSQIKSDVLNCTIRVRQSDFDAALVGNALLAIRALGRPVPQLPSGDTGAVYTPDPALRELYEQRYAFYRRVLQANRPLFALNEV